MKRPKKGTMIGQIFDLLNTGRPVSLNHLGTYDSRHKAIRRLREEYNLPISVDRLRQPPLYKLGDFQR